MFEPLGTAAVFKTMIASFSNYEKPLAFEVNLSCQFEGIVKETTLLFELCWGTGPCRVFFLGGSGGGGGE